MPASTATVPATMPGLGGCRGTPSAPDRSSATEATICPATNKPPAARAPRRGNSRIPLAMYSGLASPPSRYQGDVMSTSLGRSDAMTYFERVGESAFRATGHVGGAWDPDEQHVAPAL